MFASTSPVFATMPFETGIMTALLACAIALLPAIELTLSPEISPGSSWDGLSASPAVFELDVAAGSELICFGLTELCDTLIGFSTPLAGAVDMLVGTAPTPCKSLHCE